jgi:hypothetical protein
MAEVTFYGVGASGFPNPDQQIVPANLRSRAEVQFEGVLAAPSGTTANTLVTLNTPTFTDRAVVQFTGTGGSQFPPASLNPNENDLLYYVVSNSTVGLDKVVTILVAKALQPPDANIPGPGIAPALELLSPKPSGICGLFVQFVGPTGGGATAIPSPVKNSRAEIIAFTTDTMTLKNFGPVSVTNTDRFFVDGLDREVRRSPVLEIILE